MIYITQFIFVKKGKELVFEEFESNVLPLLGDHTGELLYRIRPQVEDVLVSVDSVPYEIHFLSFLSEKHLNEYLKDNRRLKFMALKEESITSSFAVKGQSF